MKMQATLIAILIPGLALAADLSPAALRASAQRGLVMLEKTSPTFIKKGGCNSCHNQMLPSAAQAYVRSRGIPTGDPIAQLPPEASEQTTERVIEFGTFGANSLGYELFSYGMMKRPADARIEAQVYNIRSLQQPDGRWHTTGNRPPLTFDDFTTTAYAIYALKTFSSPAVQADHEARIARARSWLLEAKPRTTQEHAFQLLGLVWSNGTMESRQKAATELRAMQRKDGGWAQLEATPSDAYATGMALWSMAEAGLGTSHPSYQNGLQYLLDTQAADGTWHVKTRSLPFQPYFDSGYPYAHDQWISAAGAAYATMAIAAAVEPQTTAHR